MLKNAEFHKKPEPHLIHVRVTSVRSRKCLFKGISEILFYPVFWFVRYLSAIAEVSYLRASVRAFRKLPDCIVQPPKAADSLFYAPILSEFPVLLRNPKA